MYFQDKLLASTSELRARARTFANAALPEVRTRLSARVELFKQSFDTLTSAGRELNKVARVHTARFVKDNAAIATKAGREVSALAHATFVTLTAGKPVVTPKVRKTRAKRARAAAKAA